MSTTTHERSGIHLIVSFLDEATTIAKDDEHDSNYCSDSEVKSDKTKHTTTMTTKSTNIDTKSKTPKHYHNIKLNHIDMELFNTIQFLTYYINCLSINMIRYTISSGPLSY